MVNQHLLMGAGEGRAILHGKNKMNPTQAKTSWNVFDKVDKPKRKSWNVFRQSG